MEHKISLRDRLLEKTILKLVPRANTPNQITWIRIILSLIVFYLMLKEIYLLGLIIFTIAALTDAMDGSMARTRDQVSNLGKFLDALADRMLIGAVAVILLPKFFGWGVTSVLIILELIQGTAAGLIQAKAGFQLEANWAGKAKMVVQSMAIISLFAFILSDSPVYFEIAKYGIYLSLIPLALQPFMYRSQIKT